MRKWYSPAVIVVTFLVSLAVRSRLPERVAIHWNLSGEPDGFGGRTPAALLLPAFMIVIWALLTFLPRIDPRRANYAEFASAYQLVIDGIITFMALLHFAVLASALGYPVPIGQVVPAAVGFLFILLGNVLPRARSNWWFGIRTPWTMSSDRVWARTHRVGGYIMFLTGVLFIIAAIFPGRAMMISAIILAGAGGLAIVVYSFIAWRQEQTGES